MDSIRIRNHYRLDLTQTHWNVATPRERDAWACLTREPYGSKPLEEPRPGHELHTCSSSYRSRPSSSKFHGHDRFPKLLCQSVGTTRLQMVESEKVHPTVLHVGPVGGLNWQSLVSRKLVLWRAESGEHSKRCLLSDQIAYKVLSSYWLLGRLLLSFWKHVLLLSLLLITFLPFYNAKLITASSSSSSPPRQ